MSWPTISNRLLLLRPHLIWSFFSSKFCTYSLRNSIWSICNSWKPYSYITLRYFYGLDQLNICMFYITTSKEWPQSCCRESLSNLKAQIYNYIFFLQNFSNFYWNFRVSPPKLWFPQIASLCAKQFMVVVCLMEKVAIGRKYVKGHATREELLCAHKLVLTHTLATVCVWVCALV